VLIGNFFPIVLNLKVAMIKRIGWFMLFLFIFALALPVSAAGEPRVDSPRRGDVLQGNVPVNGNTDLPDFKSQVVSFTYDQDTNGTWFIIAKADAPVKNGKLADWDTTTISDGDYALKVSVIFNDGSRSDVVISGLKVRNYTRLATQVPQEAGQPIVTDEVTAAPTLAASTPVTLPSNPAAVSHSQLYTSMVMGVILVLAVMMIFGIYFAIRSWNKKE
jgi:hypothetical protein